jgi:hypothetical protein
MKRILEANEEELAGLPFMTPKVAHEVFSSLRAEGGIGQAGTDC